MKVHSSDEMRIKDTLIQSNSQKIRQELHPLEKHDPVLVKHLDFVTLEFLETAKHPIPKNQLLNKQDAFNELTGRSVLVALSHGWFYQMHPDPEGVKIDIIVKEFGPRLRKAYPETQILFFFDFLSVPQWPRTKSEEKIFRVAMKHMNSVYVHCDVVLFIETELPKVDAIVRTAKVRVSDYSWTQFVDTIQVVATKYNDYGPQQYDCIIKCDDKTIQSIEDLKSFTSTHVLSYLKRPFGRPNTILNDDRGWLFLERITIAIKAATAGEHRFDAIVLSNDESLRTQVYKWMRMLLRAAQEENELRRTLERFDGILKTKRFSFQRDEETVRKLMTELVENFAENWEDEIVKQKSSSQRLREILLRWGEFSNDYVKEAKLLKQENEQKGWMWYTLGKIILVGAIAPSLAVVPYVLKITDVCVESLVGHSVWIGIVTGAMVTNGVPMILLTFCSIPLGVHTLRFFIYLVTLNSTITLVFRLVSSNRIPPFLYIYFCITSVIFSTYFYKIQFFTHRNERDGRVQTYGIEPWMKYPASMRHDMPLRASAEYLGDLMSISIVFSMFYPILGGLFFQSNVVVQACLVPVFFGIRAWMEYENDKLVTKTYGSDKVPFLSLGCVNLHEVCLSIMITSIKHPLIFITLVLADVFENAFCLWSLSRAKSMGNNVVPIEDDSSISQKSVPPKKSLKKRSSSVYMLSKDLREGDNSKGTALFITAILLQREFIETTVPIQAALVITFLYVSGIKSNSAVSNWSSDGDYYQALTYLMIDLGVELVVFACSVLALNRIYPEFSSFRILMGVLETNTWGMFSNLLNNWTMALLFQNTLSGLDLTLKFEWLSCDGENATWVGGFDWDGCS